MIVLNKIKYLNVMKHLLIFTAAIVCFNAVIMDGECRKIKKTQLKQQYKTEKDNNKLPILQDKLTNEDSNNFESVTINKSNETQLKTFDEQYKGTESNVQDIKSSFQNVNTPTVISSNKYGAAVPPPPVPPPPPPTVPTVQTVKTDSSDKQVMSLEEELAQKMSGLKKVEQNQVLSGDKKMQQEMLAIRAKLNKNKGKESNIENSNVLKDNKKYIIPVYKPIKQGIQAKPKLTRQEQLVVLDNNYNNIMKTMQQLEKIINFSKNEHIVSETNAIKYKLEQKTQLSELNNVYNSITKSMRSIKETITDLIKNNN